MASACRPPVDLKSQPGFGTVAYICIGILYMPIVILMIFSFNGGDQIMHWEGIGTRWYVKAVGNQGFLAAAALTMEIAIIATIISTIAATLAAIGMTRVKPWRGMAPTFMVINLPLMVPEIITAVATLSFFALLDISLGIKLVWYNLNIILAHTVFCIPFAYMPIRARLEDMDLTLETAAADLYATPWMAFRRVTLPLLVPGIASGAALAFITSFDDFTITQLIAGAGQTTLPLYIWTQIRLPLTPEINAISTLLLTVSVSFIMLSFLITKRRK
jgi:spermidine/putrescine transport system permease protein